jgi:uncharacterized protein with LGFP repeats
VRRLITAGSALLVATGVVLVLPVTSAPTVDPEPVETAVHEVALGSAADPAPGVAVVEQPAAEEGTGPATTDAGGTPTLRVSRPAVPAFSLVGLTWAHDPEVVDVALRVRVHDEAGGWGAWTEVGVEDAAVGSGASGGRRAGTAPLWTGPSTGVEAEVTVGSGAAPVDLQLDLVDPGTSPADEVPGRPVIQDTADAAATMPDVYSRAQWGADERLRTWRPEYAGSIKAATIHHTAGANGYAAAEVPEIVRAIYRYHAVSLGWGDIGYNVLADRFGRLWEGRSGGLASTVIGAHAGGFNTYTFGVSMIGNYDTVDTTPAMVDAVAAIASWKLSLYGVNPKGTTTLTSSGGGTSRYAAGQRVTLPTIFAHREVGSTACPGRYGFARMGEIRAKAAGEYVDVTRITARYQSDAAARAVLGSVVSPPDRTAAGLGAFADYTGGSLYYSAPTGVRLVRGPVRDFWRLVGAEGSVLRFPTADVAPTADGAGQVGRFQGGSVYWSEETGARSMLGAIGDFYRAVGAVMSPLGYPTRSVSWLPDKVGQYATFENGAIYWSPETGARTMMGEVGDFYELVGGVDSPLGYPTASVSWLPDKVGQYATFENGAIYWSPETGARTMMGEVGAFWSANGGVGGVLGYPTRSVSWLPDKVGQYATFQGGTVYWSPTTGTRTVLGAIEDFYDLVGGVRSPLGYPTQSVTWLPDKVGQYARFQRGSIYWSPKTGARTMMGPVGDFWLANGGVGGVLGYPTRSVSWLPDKVGQYATFQGGSVYWSPRTGTRTMMGPIGSLFTATGGVGGALGYPTQSVSWLPDRVGQYAAFERGAIWWKPATGAHVLSGAFLTAYRGAAAERGGLGYPTRSTYAVSGGSRMDFERGTITVSSSTGRATVTLR